MEKDDLELTAGQILDLLDDVGRLPQEPRGPHLDDEDMFDLTHGLMSASRKTAAFAHLESCSKCAGDAVQLAHAHELEKQAEAAAAVTVAYAIERGVKAAAIASLWMVARRHASCVARSHRVRATRSLQARSDWKPFEANPKLSCAIQEDAAGRTFRLRSLDAAWVGKPILCRISRIGDGDALAPWADVWVMIPPSSHAGATEFIGVARLPDGEAIPQEWRADVELCEPDAQQKPDIGLLRQAIDMAAREADRQAWRDWVAREVAGGRLPPDVTRKLFPR